MPRALDLGDNASTCLDVLTLAVRPGDSVIVNNVAGSTVSYYTNLTSSAAGTIAASSNATFTTPTWLTSAGRSSLTLSGGIYGT